MHPGLSLSLAASIFPQVVANLFFFIFMAKRSFNLQHGQYYPEGKWYKPFFFHFIVRVRSWTFFSFLFAEGYVDKVILSISSLSLFFFKWGCRTTCAIKWSSQSHHGWKEWWWWYGSDNTWLGSDIWEVKRSRLPSYFSSGTTHNHFLTCLPSFLPLLSLPAYSSFFKFKERKVKGIDFDFCSHFLIYHLKSCLLNVSFHKYVHVGK